MASSIQLGLTDDEQTYAKKRTRRQLLIEEMDPKMSWKHYFDSIRAVYHQPSTEGGRPPLPLEVILRIHLLQ